jgi:protein-tyrosine phosphatase
MRLLFVCLGNICRSPTAEAVMRALLDERGLADRVHVESAGTGGWHVGEPPDRRSAEEAARRGITMQGAAQQVSAGDFATFDLLVAMDGENEHALRRLAPDDAARAKVVRLRAFDPEAVAAGDLDVPDPYYGGADGFREVFDLVERACRGLLGEVTERLAAA